MATLGTNTAAQQSGHAPDIGRLRRPILEEVGLSVPSMAVAVVRDRRIVCEDTFGWAERDRRIAAINTPFYFGSATKALTASLIGGLVHVLDPLEYATSLLIIVTSCVLAAKCLRYAPPISIRLRR